jgi:acyl-CoA thioesterase-1
MINASSPDHRIAGRSMLANTILSDNNTSPPHRRIDTMRVHLIQRLLNIFLRNVSMAIPALILMTADVRAAPALIEIVAIGASNTSGWGVSPQNAYPARLQAMLREKGFNVRVTNAGMILDTTTGMLKRIDGAAPAGTRLVILQPGGNDLRFFGTRERREANIAAMVARLRARKIEVIVFDPKIPRQYYQFDGIHITAEGHARFASALLPQVIAVLAR